MGFVHTGTRQRLLDGLAEDGTGRNPWEQRFDAEEQSEVSISGDFHLGRFEVTQRMGRGDGGSRNRSRFRGDDLPVENVSWDDTQLFLRKLNEKMQPTGQSFRPPTEAE